MIPVLIFSSKFSRSLLYFNKTKSKIAAADPRVAAIIEHPVPHAEVAPKVKKATAKKATAAIAAAVATVVKDIPIIFKF